MDSTSIKETLDKMKESAPDNPNMAEFFKLFTKVNDKAQGKDCPDNDCDDLLSKCCNKGMVTVFGTMPLLVKCVKCDKTYVLRELLNVEKVG